MLVAIKMPLLIALTLAGNWFLNGLMGILLGSGFGFQQSLYALLKAFAISGLILASLSPICLYFALSMPGPGSDGAKTAHSVYLLSHVCLIGVAGVVGLLRLRSHLRGCCPSPAIALRTLSAWVTGNALLGTQFSWIFRPFIGSPGLEVRMFREDAMEGSFIEAVWAALIRFPMLVEVAMISCLSLMVAAWYDVIKKTKTKKEDI